MLSCGRVARKPAAKRFGIRYGPPLPSGAAISAAGAISPPAWVTKRTASGQALEPSASSRPTMLLWPARGNTHVVGIAGLPTGPR